MRLYGESIAWNTTRVLYRANNIFKNMKEEYVIAFNPKSKEIGCNIIAMLNENIEDVKQRVSKFSLLKVFVMPLGQFISGAKSNLYY